VTNATTYLSAAQRRRFEEDGFLLIPNFKSPAESRHAAARIRLRAFFSGSAVQLMFGLFGADLMAARATHVVRVAPLERVAVLGASFFGDRNVA